MCCARDATESKLTHIIVYSILSKVSPQKFAPLNRAFEQQFMDSQLADEKNASIEPFFSLRF